MAALRTSPRPVVQLVAEIKAFLANELVAMMSLNMAPLVSVVAAPGTTITTIPVPSVTFQPLGSNIQDILDDIKLDVDSYSSVGWSVKR
jgi:hypothetical protein